MTADRRPLLAFGPPVASARPKQALRSLPRLSRPGAARQGERLTPQFKVLKDAFASERARLSLEAPDEIDPALVVVFDLAGTVKDFQNAINRVEGLEFLSELVADRSTPDDDFHMVERTGARTDKRVAHSLYLVMSNSKAIDELLRLFTLWQAGPSAAFEYGLGKFKAAFEQLTAIRRWSAEDRIRETGLLERWEETVSMIGQSVSTVLVEVELWHRRNSEQRTLAEAHVEHIVTSSGGRVVDRSQIVEIEYHALLVELPIQQVQYVLANGAEAIRLLTSDDVMFVSPFTPMSVSPTTLEPEALTDLLPVERSDGKPRVALLDGLPFANHVALQGRLLIDDPDGLGEAYPVAARHHGTAMASLIIHGDITEGSEPLDRPLYVRPILRPHEFIAGQEQVVPDRLLPDLLHRAIRRMMVGEGNQPAAAPSVRVVNLSIGAQTRALTRIMSPAGRLLDWLASSYNLLFVVSAGNHVDELTIPSEATRDVAAARVAATRAVYGSGLLRGILPPGDALNALTVGASHSDALGEVEATDTVWDIRLFTIEGVVA